MNEPHLTIGPLMKAARKFKKLNQSDVAEAIGCSQSALSKMEHNLLTPNAPQWFLFSRFTSIPPETLELGIIDRQTEVRLNNESVSAGFKLPKRYRINKSQKVREVYPFLHALQRMYPQDHQLFLDNAGIDEEFYIDFDNLVSFQIIVDLINLFIQLEVKTIAQVENVVKIGQNSLYWDKFNGAWSEPIEVLFEFAKTQLTFQIDFIIRVEMIKEVLLVSYLPQPHVYHFLKDLNLENQKWLNNYRKFTLESLVYNTLGKKIQARLLPDLSKSPLEAHFEIQ
jgi:transcriptional regulator with XRE-family HTH domain